ncbi:putative uncharacterized protein DDB_G0290521 [Xenia sp. Carnegie-2017]|uniref:putative uncharacterized protein DDB_G0290521 n=1 Tax=Xenia sp. Carnegie-2017 TaxID=2897299 RepID=UPI001F0409A2|nr:putative uncharacterized protein DDB_G0290521 [Xenia sp. Carnegie-2017]
MAWSNMFGVLLFASFFAGVLSLNCSCAHDFLCFNKPITECAGRRICFAAEVRTSNGSILVKKGCQSPGLCNRFEHCKTSPGETCLKYGCCSTDLCKVNYTLFPAKSSSPSPSLNPTPSVAKPTMMPASTSAFEHSSSQVLSVTEPLMAVTTSFAFSTTGLLRTELMSSKPMTKRNFSKTDEPVMSTYDEMMPTVKMSMTKLQEPMESSTMSMQPKEPRESSTMSMQAKEPMESSTMSMQAKEPMKSSTMSTQALEPMKSSTMSSHAQKATKSAAMTQLKEQMASPSTEMNSSSKIETSSISSESMRSTGVVVLLTAGPTEDLRPPCKDSSVSMRSLNILVLIAIFCCCMY